MSWFEFDITYIKGELNKVTNCLSRYYESNTNVDIHDVHNYVQADTHIDPTGEDLPTQWFHEIKNNVIEIRALREGECRQSNCL
jgi:hypothetical protein